MRENLNGDGLDLVDYLRVVRRRIAWVLVPLVLGGVAAYLYTNNQALVYRSSARVLLESSAAQDAIDSRLVGAGAKARELENEINLAESDPARQAVREHLQLNPDDPLPEGTITADTDSDVLQFTFEAATPDQAAFVANTWASVYVDLKQEAAEGSISRATERLRTQLDELRQERDQIRADLEALEDRQARALSDTERDSLQLQIDREASAISGELNLVDAQIEANIQSITQLQLSGELATDGTAWIYQSALPPNGPINAPLAQNLAIGIVVGAVVGAALGLLRETLDRTVNTAEDIQRLGLTALGAIPKASKNDAQYLAQVSLFDPTSPIADAYQKVRSALQFVALGNDARTILVTSPTEGNGKTTTAVNLALAFSGVDHKVVLVDADMRRPKIHKVFNTSLVPGITDALVNQIPLDRIAVASSTESRSSLAALPAGTEPPNPATFLASPLFASLHEELQAQSDMTVFDSPPILPVADTTSLCPHADGVVVVVEAGHTTRDELVSAVEVIDRAGGVVLGVVLTKAKVTSKTYYQPDGSKSPAKGSPSKARPNTGMRSAFDAQNDLPISVK